MLYSDCLLHEYIFSVFVHWKRKKTFKMLQEIYYVSYVEKSYFKQVFLKDCFSYEIHLIKLFNIVYHRQK